MLEREPLARLAAAGELRAYRHEGFWQCMDTLKDALALNDLWDSGAAPWRLWDGRRGREPGRRGRARPTSLSPARRILNRATGSRIPFSRRSPANEPR